MALHRDIFWVGRQWAVTGYGLQAVDQKLKGNFDIEAARLWEEGLLESMRAEPWLNVEDFGKALSVTGPEDAAARGACRGSARNRLEKRDLARNELARNEFARNELEKASDRGAQTGRSKLRHACRRLAREIRAAMAYSYQAVTAPAGVGEIVI